MKTALPWTQSPINDSQIVRFCIREETGLPDKTCAVISKGKQFFLAVTFPLLFRPEPFTSLEQAKSWCDLRLKHHGFKVMDDKYLLLA